MCAPYPKHTQLEFQASIMQWKQKRAQGERPTAQKPTVDQELANRLSTAPLQELTTSLTIPDSTLSLSEADAVSAHDSDVMNDYTGEVPSNIFNTMTGHAQENWAVIKSFFTDKTFPPPPPGPLENLLSQRRIRNITPNSNSLARIQITWPKDWHMLIVQLTCRESPAPCNRCRQGHGIFDVCVPVPRFVAQSEYCACVNCSWKSQNRKTCDLKAILRAAKRAPGEIDGPQQQQQQQQRVPTAKDGDDDSDQPLQYGGRRASGPNPEAQVDDGFRDSSDSDRPLRMRRSGRLAATRDKSDSDQPLRARRRHGVARTSARDVGRASPNTHRAGAQLSARLPVEGDDEGVVTRRIMQSTMVDEDFSFRVDVILPGKSVSLQPDFENLRLCSLASGRVVVKVQGEAVFEMGFQGMFKLVPGIRADVLNSTSMEAVLHTSCSRQRE